MLGYNLAEWPFIFIAWISAILSGLSFAAYAILFGECLEVIATDNFDELNDDRVKFYGELFIIAGAMMGLTIFFKVRKVLSVNPKYFDSRFYRDI